jgi:anti-anti-sigma factor
MQFITEQIESITVVTIKGRIDAASSDDLHASLTTLVHEGQKYLLINCEEVEFLSSGGMRAFLLTVKEVEKHKGKIVFCKFNEVIKEILHLSGTSKYFQHFDDLTDALNELKQ